MATEYSGYMGKILHVDLTAETAEEYPWTDDQRRQTLGGKAAAIEILSKHLTGRTQPFSDENLLIISTGPLTGTGAPGSDRFEITTLSPKTGMVTSSNCGGKFGIDLKKAGLDILILSGRCNGRRWLDIRETGACFHDAQFLWGLDTSMCRRNLEAQLSDRTFGSLCIGPAGEDLLPCSTIICGDRSAGRAGFGAVMGWKRLKAVTVSGSMEVTVHDREATSALLRQWHLTIAGNPLTSDPSYFSSCPGCPIRCKKKEPALEPWMNGLGVDSLEAENHRPWLRKHGIDLPERPLKNAHGKRREKLYGKILSQLNLAPEERFFQLYQDLTEALSALGLCIFTAGSCILSAAAKENQIDSIDPTRFLLHSTGLALSMDQLLAVGKKSRDLQNQLHRKDP